jgi:hypothetical protein
MDSMISASDAGNQRDPMNVQSLRTASAQDDRAATQPLAATADSAPARDPSDQQALALKLATRGGSMPHLTGEIRGLVYIRLREVALLVTVGWSLVLLLCLRRIFC